MSIRILKRKEVEAMTGLSRASIYSKMAKREFPLQVKLSESSVGWVESEVQAWLQARLDERDERVI